MPVVMVLLALIITLSFFNRPLVSIVVDSAIIGGLIFGGLWRWRGIIGGALSCGAVAWLLFLKFSA